MIRRRAVGSGVAACAVALLFGCEDAARAEEASRVSRAVDAVRDAPSDQKAPLLRALEATPCSLEDVCALKDRCTAAYRLHVAGVEATGAVRHALRPGTDGGDARSAAQLLLGATEDVAAAKEATSACAAQQHELARRYDLL